MSSSTAGGIWPCATATFTSGTVLVEEFLGAREVLDARAHIERLPAAIALAQQRLAHHQRIERRHEGAHRQAVDRRRRDDRKIAHTGQRQLQGARDRGRGQRQHMDLGAQLLQPLLVGDAEVLLLVDDDKAEILELDGLAEQRVGADHDIDADRRQAPCSSSSSSAAATRREACADLQREAAEALGEGLVVLARQQRGRHHDRDLLAAHRRDEGRAQRHLGLAEADVAADQAVHRPAGAEIVDARRRWRPAGLRSPRRGSRREFVIGAVRDGRAAAPRAIAARPRS